MFLFFLCTNIIRYIYTILKHIEFENAMQFTRFGLWMAKFPYIQETDDKKKKKFVKKID